MPGQRMNEQLRVFTQLIMTTEDLWNKITRLKYCLKKAEEKSNGKALELCHKSYNKSHLLKNKWNNILIRIKYLLEKQHSRKQTVHRVLAIVYVSYRNGFKSTMITRMNLVKTKNTYGSQSWNKLSFWRKERVNSKIKTFLHISTNSELLESFLSS